MTPTISRRVLNAAISQAKALSAKIKIAYGAGKITTWADVENKYGFVFADFTPDAKKSPIQSGVILNMRLDAYVRDTESRMLKAHEQNNTKTAKLLLANEEDCWQFPDANRRLYTEQQPAFDKAWDVLFKQNRPLSISNGGMGSGKTAIAIALVDRFIRENRHVGAVPLPFPILYFTVKNAVEQTKEKFIEYGLGEYVDTVIHFFPYSALSSSQGEGRLYTRRTEQDPFNEDSPEIEIFEWLPMGMPFFVFIDEAHKLARRTTAAHRAFKALLAQIKALPFLNTKTFIMSGTLAEKINDLEYVVCAADIDYGGQKITEENFKQVFANPIANGRPDVVNAEAMRRAFNVLSPIVAEIPYVPWPFKAINSVRYYEFRTPEDKAYYKASWDRYVERCEKLGKDASANARYGPFLMFRKDVEPLRALQIADQMHEDVQNGFTPGMGVAFTAPIIKAIFYLIDTYGYTRDDFAVIWGGRQNIKPEKILTPQDIAQIMQDTLEGKEPDKNLQKCLKNNILWQDDRILFGDTSEDNHDSRYQRLLDLKLIGLQNPERRREQVKNFMSGRAKMCFYTSAAGGTGLSLEHFDETGRPRRGYYSPIYSGKEFSQFLCRFPRRNSISDTYQWTCLMANTIESEHVAPILDLKLRSLGEFATRKTDLATLLMTDEVLKQSNTLSNKLAQVRTLDEATKDAHENEATQSHVTDEADDEDEDE